MSIKEILINSKHTKLLALIAIVLIMLVVAGVLASRPKTVPIAADDAVAENYASTTFNESGIVTGVPGDMVPDQDRIPFDVNESVIRIHILVTWDVEEQDIDIWVEDAAGNTVKSSGNPPGEPEEIVIEQKYIRLYEYGTWTLFIDPYAAVTCTYTAEGTLTYIV